ncbi:hypothetical protein D3C84_825540 [compost metagenome]
MQFAVSGFTGHAAARKHTSTTQAATRLINIQFNATFMALRNCNHHHTVVSCSRKGGEKLRVVARPGAAAVTLQYQALNAAVQNTIKLLGADAGNQWQHADFRQ